MPKSTDFAQKWGTPKGKGAQMSIDFGEASADQIKATVQAMVRANGAIRFGTTRDGGAIAIGLYLGGAYRPEYLKPNDDLEAYLMTVEKMADEYVAAGYPDLTQTDWAAKRSKKA